MISVSAGPQAQVATATFRVPDPAGRLSGVRLVQNAGIPGDRLGFRRAGDAWELIVDRPAVHRMEYQLELSYAGGGQETVLDPGNPLQAPGAFGPRSVLRFPEYVPPGWLGARPEPGPGSRITIELPAPPLAEPVRATVWSPAGTGEAERLPLLVAHDGPEYDAMASLIRYLAAGVAGGWLPPLRAALLHPGPRDRWYSANPRYARALGLAVLPALADRFPPTVTAGMGASLGALAMLHLHRRYPSALDALFLQSGSYFTPVTDPRERRFRYYRRVVQFVAAVHRGAGVPRPVRPVPVSLTCGAIEENLGNNRQLARALTAQGYPVTLREVPDGHNFTAWRDAFDPGLSDLLREVR